MQWTRRWQGPKNFCKWIEKLGVEVSAKVRIGKEGSCDRYGMVAISNIEQYEVLFTIPKYVCMNFFLTGRF